MLELKMAKVELNYLRIMRDGLVRTAGLEPALPVGKQIFVPLRLSPPPCARFDPAAQAFVVWTIPSP